MPLMWMTSFILLSSHEQTLLFVKPWSTGCGEKKKDQKSTLDCYHLALFSKLLRETWVIKAFMSRYLGTVSTDYFLFLHLLPQYFPSSVDFSSSGGLFLSPRKLSLWNLLLNFATRISNSRKRKAN